MTRLLPKWDQRFLALAEHVASWSRDPSTKVGCVIADPLKRVVSLGFNGFAQRVNDNPERLDDRPIRLRMTLHAEENAVLTAESRRVIGATCYIWPLLPCAHCAAVLIQSGITRVVAPSPSPALLERWGNDLDLAREQFTEAGVFFEMVSSDANTD